MDELPELALLRVLNSLPLVDQLATRLVCKRWKQLTEESLTNSTSVLILFYRIERRPLVWHYNDQPANLDNSLVVNSKMHEAKQFWQLFKNIKKLYIAFCQCFREMDGLFDVQQNIYDYVNNFPALKHLELEDWCIYESQRKRQLFLFNLPNLKTVFCHTRMVTKINSAMLAQLRLFEDFHSKKPYSFRDSLKLLKVWSFSYESGCEFPNLESLYFSGDLQIRIGDFKKLKEIHHACFDVLKNPDSQNFDERFGRVVSLFDDLFEQKRRLQRDSLRIYFEGVRCEAGSTRKIATRERLRRFYRNFFAHFIVQKADLEAFQQNRDDFKVENLRMHLEYTSELDDVIAAMNDEQIERLARSVDRLTLVDSLNNELLLSSKFEKLFRYVRRLHIDEERFTQADQFDLLPSILSSVTLCHKVKQDRGLYWRRNPLPWRVTSRFKGLEDAELCGEEATPDELKKMLDSSRFIHCIKIRTGSYAAEIWNMRSRKVPNQKRLFLSKYRRDGSIYDISDPTLLPLTDIYPDHEKLIESIVEKKFFDQHSIEKAMSTLVFWKPGKSTTRQTG